MLLPLYPVAFLFRPLRNNQPVFFAPGTGTRTVPVHETSVLYINRRPGRLCNLTGPKEGFQ